MNATDTFIVSCERLAATACAVYGESEGYDLRSSSACLLTEVAALASACVDMQRTDVSWSSMDGRRRAAAELSMARSDLTEAARNLEPLRIRLATGPAHVTCVMAILLIDRLLPVVSDCVVYDAERVAA